MEERIAPMAEKEVVVMRMEKECAQERRVDGEERPKAEARVPEYRPMETHRSEEQSSIPPREIPVAVHECVAVRRPIVGRRIPDEAGPVETPIPWLPNVVVRENPVAGDIERILGWCRHGRTIIQ
jgi:hypothetical protein